MPDSTVASAMHTVESSPPDSTTRCPGVWMPAIPPTLTDPIERFWRFFDAHSVQMRH